MLKEFSSIPGIKLTFVNLTSWDRYFILYLKYLLQKIFLYSKCDFWIKFQINIVSCFLFFTRIEAP